MLEADSLWVRRAGQLTQAVPADDVGAALEAVFETGLASEHFIFYASPHDWQRRSREIEALRDRCASLKVQLLNSGPLPLLAPQLVQGGFINLLSGEYAPKTSFGSGWQRWRLAAILAVALFAVHVGGLALELFQQQRSERRLHT